uniref:HTH psq-type domain-containing protein n=1 Tax=Anopheles atroparvus TaxID=41427 RepID=A0AAG5CZW3_ANOAO
MSSMSEDSNGVPRRKMTNTYTRQDLKNAINLIVERGISIRRAAYMCNVPRTTLATYLKSITHGKVSKLHPDEEQALYQWMTDCCKRGFSIKKRNVDTAAEALVQKSVPPRTHPFQDTDFGKQCYQKFVRRWLSIDRVKDRKHVGVVADWFLHIECFLTESNLFEILSSPNRIFLCDELRFRERVEMQEPVRAMLKKMTMLYTFSAAGEHLSPLLVYPYRRDVPPDIVKAAPKNCAIVAHEYGQVTPKTFAAYLDKVVDKFVTANNITKPVIIFVDESQVDLTLHLHNTCKRLGIVLLGLTAAHVVKPTANVFNDICAGWEQELPQFESQSGRSFTLADCAGLMQTVDQRYIKSEVLIKDFKASYLYPWIRPNRTVVDSGAVAAVASTSEDVDNMEPDDEDDDNEIENFLEHVDGWSDGDDEDVDLDLDNDEDFMDDDEDDDDDDGGDVTTEPTTMEKEPAGNLQQDPATGTTGTADNGNEQQAAVTPATATGDSAVKDETNGTTNETDRKSAHEVAQFTSNTDDEHEGPPDDIDISINFIDFKRAIGKELTEKFERKLETQNRLALTNHAENVLYDIYRQFRCDVVTDSDDDYDIVEIGDD